MIALLTSVVFAAGSSVYPQVSIDLSRLQDGGLGATISADHQGNIVLTGVSRNCSLPVVHPLSTCGWLWIAKLDPTGQTILFATYFGDSKTPAGLVWAQPDLDGNITVLTSINQTSLPAVNAFQPQDNGNYDAYVFKVAADGSRIIYATYLGGSGFDNPLALAVDSQGSAYVMLESGSGDFPTTPQSVKSTATHNWVVAKLSPDGQTLGYAASFPMGQVGVPSLGVDSSGAALATVENQLFQLTPDGSSVQAQPLPPWANPNPTSVPDNAGGYWLAGTKQNQILPTTPDAFESSRSPIPYLRIEKGQIPPLAKPITAQYVSGFAIDPYETWRVYAATNAGLFVTEDNGWTWNPTSLTAICESVAVDPLDQNTVYVTSGNNFYRSTDRSATWVALSSGVIGTIGVDAQVPGLIYTTAGRSEDGGVTWKPFVIPQPVNGPCGSGCLSTNAVAVQADPVQGRRVYVFTQTKCIGFCLITPGLLRSDDAGATFVGVPMPASAGGLAVDQETQDLFLVSNGTVAVYRDSILDKPEVLAVPEAQTVAADPGNPGTVYLGLTNSTVIQSVDGGRTWTTLITLPAPPSLIAVSINGVLHLTQPSTLTDAFAFHYNAGQILYGTVFGGWYTTGTTAALGSNGHLYLGGFTGGGLPLKNAWQSNFGGRTDAFVAEFDANGALLNSTYLGGKLDEQVTSLVPQDDGSVVVVGYSNSNEFWSQFDPSAIGTGSYFVLRLHSSP